MVRRKDVRVEPPIWVDMAAIALGVGLVASTMVFGIDGAVGALMATTGVFTIVSDIILSKRIRRFFVELFVNWF
jgi:hypothetical protein